MAFRASKRLLGVERLPDQELVAQAGAVSIILGETYRGDIDALHLLNIQCPEELNCTVHIENVPVPATNAEVLQEVTDGAVYSYSRREPILGRFQTFAVGINVL